MPKALNLYQELSAARGNNGREPLYDKPQDKEKTERNARRGGDVTETQVKGLPAGSGGVHERRLSCHRVPSLQVQRSTCLELTVHHYYPLGTDNVGDRLVAHAAANAGAHFGPAIFVDMPANDAYQGTDRSIGLTGANIDRSNAEADLVLVGGSNMLEPRKPRRHKQPGGSWGLTLTGNRSLGLLLHCCWWEWGREQLWQTHPCLPASNPG